MKMREVSHKLEKVVAVKVYSDKEVAILHAAPKVQTNGGRHFLS